MAGQAVNGPDQIGETGMPPHPPVCTENGQHGGPQIIQAQPGNVISEAMKQGLQVCQGAQEQPQGEDSALSEQEDQPMCQGEEEYEQARPTSRRRGQPNVIWMPTVVAQKKQQEAGGVEQVDSSGSDYDEPEVVLERNVDEQQAERDAAHVKGMAEYFSILEFIFLFRHQLQLETLVTYSSLMDALIHSPGPGLLASLHTELLKGVVSSKALNETNWTHYLSNRLMLTWSTLSPAQGPPPFHAPKHQEAQAYAALSTRDRVLTLKAVCDMRLEREDLRNAIETAVLASDAPAAGAGGSKAAGGKAPAAGRRAGSSGRGQSVEPRDLSADLMRKQPLGVDGSGFTYWWFDWCDMSVEGGNPMGSFLVREGPPANIKTASSASAAATTSGYQVPALPAAGQWEVAASSLDELEAYGAKLGRSLRPADKRVAEQINQVLVPELQGRVEEQERWRKAKERTRKMLGLDVGLSGLDRSCRQRKPVNYRDDVYDKAMAAAIKKGGGEEQEEQLQGRRGKRRAAASSPPRPEAGAGRRGRSRGSDVDLIALDMDGPTRRGVFKLPEQDGGDDPHTQQEARLSSSPMPEMHESSV